MNEKRLFGRGESNPVPPAGAINGPRFMLPGGVPHYAGVLWKGTGWIGDNQQRVVVETRKVQMCVGDTGITGGRGAGDQKEGQTREDHSSAGSRTPICQGTQGKIGESLAEVRDGFQLEGSKAAHDIEIGFIWDTRPHGFSQGQLIRRAKALVVWEGQSELMVRLIGYDSRFDQLFDSFSVPGQVHELGNEYSKGANPENAPQAMNLWKGTTLPREQARVAKEEKFGTSKLGSTHPIVLGTGEPSQMDALLSPEWVTSWRQSRDDRGEVEDVGGPTYPIQRRA
ncbi:hypothetical protein K438DRAFT_1765256 [Mycena galopus ATCC 62051]|nr:hypothetical protein K438DRAFT_1765256 [Mycena galopus ATCC 62051]